MSALARHSAAISSAVLALTLSSSAYAYEPVNDIISARIGGVVSGTDYDKGYQHEFGSAWAAWLRLQFGASFGQVAHVALAWEPRLGYRKTSSDPEGALDGLSPFEILGGAWLKLGGSRGMLRTGYYWDYGSYAMLRLRYDWGGGAVEGTFAAGHSLRAALGYRFRLSDHWLLVSELRGERLTESQSYSFGPVEGPMQTGSRNFAGYGAEALLSVEWTWDGER